MLKIRPAQLEAFQTVTENAFQQRVLEYLRENQADTVVGLPDGEFKVEELGDDVLRKMVRNGVARARQYGMTWESSITSFVVLMFVVAPNFDDHALIQRALQNERVEPDARIEEIWDHTTEENWEAARAAYDTKSWMREEK